jgi:vacuolar-type H+-ATPase subunit H
MKEMYYCNKPCIVKQELPNDEVVIELEVGESYIPSNWDEPGYNESLEVTIIVNKKYLSEKPIDYEKDLNFKIKTTEEKARKIINEAETKSRELLKEANDKLKTLENKITKLSLLKPIWMYLEKDVEWILKSYSYRSENEFDFNFIKLKDLNKKNYDDFWFQITFEYYQDRGDATSKLKMRLEEGYIMDFRVEFFKSKEDLYNNVLEKLATFTSITERSITNIDHWNSLEENKEFQIKSNLINLERVALKEKKINNIKDSIQEAKDKVAKYERELKEEE